MRDGVAVATALLLSSLCIINCWDVLGSTEITHIRSVRALMLGCK